MCHDCEFSFQIFKITKTQVKEDIKTYFAYTNETKYSGRNLSSWLGNSLPTECDDKSAMIGHFLGLLIEQQLRTSNPVIGL